MNSEENKKYEEAGKYLAGEPGSHDLSGLEGLDSIWEAAGKFKYPEASGNDAAWNSIKDMIGAEKSQTVLKTTWIRRNSWAVAAGLGLMIMAGAGIWISNNRAETEMVAALKVSTGNNEFKTVDLADGSAIKLGSNSSLVIAEGFGQQNRKITLTGQAGFEVAKNASLPFEVIAGKTVTTVIGTGFDIQAYPGESVGIYVKHGKVSFASGAQKVLLEKGDAGMLNAAGSDLSKVENMVLLPWENGEWVFKRTPLSEIATLFKHRFGKELKFASADAQRQFTGKFNASATPEEIAATIEEALQVDLTIE